MTTYTIEGQTVSIERDVGEKRFVLEAKIVIQHEGNEYEATVERPLDEIFNDAHTIAYGGLERGDIDGELVAAAIQATEYYVANSPELFVGHEIDIEPRDVLVHSGNVKEVQSIRTFTDNLVPLTE